jgi:hypothetical protein
MRGIERNVLEKIFIHRQDMVTNERKKLYNEDFVSLVLISASVIKQRTVELKVWHSWRKLQMQGNFGLKLCRVILKSVLREWGVDLDLSHLAYREKWRTLVRR